MPDENQQPNPERKSLDDRAKMTELERIRHSCAHVLATAILRKLEWERIALTTADKHR